MPMSRCSLLVNIHASGPYSGRASFTCELLRLRRMLPPWKEGTCRNLSLSTVYSTVTFCSRYERQREHIKTYTYIYICIRAYGYCGRYERLGEYEYVKTYTDIYMYTSQRIIRAYGYTCEELSKAILAGHPFSKETGASYEGSL